MLTVTYTIASGATTTLSFAETTPPADQRAMIQSALDSVAGAGGGTVALSAGVFTLAGTGTAADGVLRVGSNTVFEGAGMGTTTIKLADGSGTTTGIVRTDSGQTLADGSVKTTEHVLIRNMSIDGNKANTTGEVDGIYTGAKPSSGQFDYDITIDSVEVLNVSRYGFDPHEGTVALTITNSVAHDNGVDGFTIDGSTDVILANNISYDNGRHGFNIVTGSENVTMTANEAYANAGSGIVVQTGDNEIRTWTSTISITGGSVHDNGRAGIEVRQASDVTIEGLSITDNARQGISLQGVEGVTITGNTIAGNGGTAIKLDGYLQTFGDAEASNDRYIATTGVSIDGVAAADPAVPPGVTLYSYAVTSGDDVITGTSVRDAIDGGRGHDTIAGDGGDDTIYGNAGNDRLDGGLGNDNLFGNAGDDSFDFTAGYDLIDGGAGIDGASFTGMSAAVYVDLARTTGANAFTSGGATANAASATTAIADLTRVENVTGSAFADMLVGDGGANVLAGGVGHDLIMAGSGADTLVGGFGNDKLTGGSGNDRFAFGDDWGIDTVADFARGKDKIVFDGASGPNTYADLRISASGQNALVTFGDDQILLTGVRATQLSAADFLFL